MLDFQVCHVGHKQVGQIAQQVKALKANMDNPSLMTETWVEAEN